MEKADVDGVQKSGNKNRCREAALPHPSHSSPQHLSDIQFFCVLPELLYVSTSKKTQIQILNSALCYLKGNTAQNFFSTKKSS